MRKIKLLMMVFALIFIYQISKAQETFISPKLTKVWETPDGLNVPESSFYNEADKTIYVSNIVGKHNVKDSIGFIAKLNDKGQFIEKEWVKGLNAPKGIGVYKNKLYVTDIDEVVEIDIKTGKILKKYRNPKAKAVNDITIDKDGKVYVTDENPKYVFTVGKDSLEVFIESDQIKSVNGGYIYDNQLIVGSKGNLIGIDLKTKTIKTLAEKTGYLDGIVSVGKDLIVTSDFGGKVQLISLGKGIEILSNTSAAKINAADLGFIPSQNLLLVPTFFNNKVIAYKLDLTR